MFRRRECDETKGSTVSACFIDENEGSMKFRALTLRSSRAIVSVRCYFRCPRHDPKYEKIVLFPSRITDHVRRERCATDGD